jgi:hypothetical protein
MIDFICIKSYGIFEKGQIYKGYYRDDIIIIPINNWLFNSSYKYLMGLKEYRKMKIDKLIQNVK